MTENPNNITNINIFINDNKFSPKKCRTCSLLVNDTLHKMVCIDSMNLNVDVISTHDKLNICCPELDLRDNLMVILCIKCSEIVKVIYQFIYKCNKAILPEHFAIAYPYIQDCGFIVKEEIKTEEVDLSDTETSFNTDKEIYNIKSENNYYKCTCCEYKSRLKHNVIIHLRIHTGEKPYNCPHCDYTCSRKNSLERHILIHTGEKPYKCSQCDYSCNQKNNLMKHVLIHTGEKPYKCSHCNYTCNRKHSLKKHTRIHTGEKPYRCSHCGFNFKQNNHLIKHLRKHTGEKPYNCFRCGYSCTQKSTLIKHLHP